MPPVSMLAEISLHWQPRWSGASPVTGLLVGVLCVVPLALIGWLYRTELRLISPPIARTLLALRLAVVTIIVGVVALRPSISTAGIETVRGRVLLAFDRSDSMGIADPQRPVTEKLRLARALRLADDLVSDSQLMAWIDSNETNTTRPNFSAVCQRIDAMTRGQIGIAALKSLLPAIDANHDAAIVGFAGAAAEFPRSAIDQLTDRNSAGSATDLGAPLDYALQSADNPPVAVILLTDGRHNAAGSPVTRAAALRKLDVPVHSILLGPQLPPPDVAIARLQAPATAFKGAEVAVEAAVQVHNLTARPLTIELQQPGRSPVVQQLQHPGGSQLHTVRIPVRLDESGLHNLTVRVRPQPEDTHHENDSRSVAIQAADDRAKVLLIDGEARWEFHYLASALARDRSIELQSVVFLQPRINAASETTDTEVASRALPAGADALDRFDAIVLGDVSPEQLTLADRVRLDRYVSDRGGTLIIVAGRGYMPSAYLGTTGDKEPLQKLLPIETARPITPANGYAIVLTALGKLTGYLQLDATPEASENRWSDLPRHYWGVAGRAKPGATVLACSQDPSVADPSNPGRWEKNHALIASQNVGFGRVLFFGLESTWRFRYRMGDVLHHRLWGQVLRWAAADQPLIVGNSKVRFGPRKAVVAQDEDLEIALRWLDTEKPLKSDSAAARILRCEPGKPDVPLTLSPLAPDEARPREWAAHVRKLPPGSYAAELAIPDRAGDLLGPNGSPLRAPFRITPSESSEMSDLSTNQPLLEELAAQSNGKVFTAENAGDIAKILQKREVRRPVRRDWPIGESWPTLAILVLLLGFEWGLRKWAGLP